MLDRDCAVDYNFSVPPLADSAVDCAMRLGNGANCLKVRI